MLAAGVLIAGFATMMAVGVSTQGKGTSSHQFGSIALSQYTVDANITIANYTAPGFTWSEPVTFNFTIDSNITAGLFIYVISDVLLPAVINMNVTAGLNTLVFTLGVLPLVATGEHNITIRFDHGASSATITHELWVGSNLIISYGILFGAIGFSIAIYAKVGSPKKPKSSSSGISGSAASAADDDTSTVTYVDQSQAPPGRIYCPECKKVIEEGSIFCPECGTRIPRYLRYHP